jgi:hypothetical protein
MIFDSAGLSIEAKKILFVTFTITDFFVPYVRLDLERRLFQFVSAFLFFDPLSSYPANVYGGLGRAEIYGFTEIKFDPMFRRIQKGLIGGRATQFYNNTQFLEYNPVTKIARYGCDLELDFCEGEIEAGTMPWCEFDMIEPEIRIELAHDCIPDDHFWDSQDKYGRMAETLSRFTSLFEPTVSIFEVPYEKVFEAYYGWSVEKMALPTTNCDAFAAHLKSVGVLPEPS